MKRSSLHFLSPLIETRRKVVWRFRTDIVEGSARNNKNASRTDDVKADLKLTSGDGGMWNDCKNKMELTKYSELCKVYLCFKSCLEADTYHKFTAQGEWLEIEQKTSMELKILNVINFLTKLPS